jgi:hypothetical protein
MDFIIAFFSGMLGYFIGTYIGEMVTNFKNRKK